HGVVARVSGCATSVAVCGRHEVRRVGDEQAETFPIEWEGGGAHPARDALDGHAGEVSGDGPVVGDVVPDRLSRTGIVGEAAQPQFRLRRGVERQGDEPHRLRVAAPDVVAVPVMFEGDPPSRGHEVFLVPSVGKSAGALNPTTRTGRSTPNSPAGPKASSLHATLAPSTPAAARRAACTWRSSALAASRSSGLASISR